MSGSREHILTSIRNSLKRGELSAEAKAAVDGRIAAHAANVVPARAQLTPAKQRDLFIAEAERVNATVERLTKAAEIPDAVQRYLSAASVTGPVKVAQDPVLKKLSWPDGLTVDATPGAAADGHLVAVTVAFAGIAESGTLVLTSGPTTPTTLNFLPDLHIVVLPTDRILGTYEEAWEKLRNPSKSKKTSGGFLPRTVNWVTGPSRTADIEQTLLLGAHGPRRLHILVVDGKAC